MRCVCRFNVWFQQFFKLILVVPAAYTAVSHLNIIGESGFKNAAESTRRKKVLNSLLNKTLSFELGNLKNKLNFKVSKMFRFSQKG